MDETKENVLTKKATKYLKHFNKVLGVFQTIRDSIPKQTDSKIGKMVKIGAIINSVTSFASNFNKIEAPYWYLHDEMGLDYLHSSFISKFVYSLWKKDALKATVRQFTSEISYVIFEFGEHKLYLYKFKAEDSINSIHSIIHTTKGFDYNILFNALWKQGNNRLVVSQKSTVDLLEINPVLYTEEDILLFKRNSKVLNPLIGSCFLISGPPGTGKTTFVYKYADLQNKKVLKLDANIIEMLGKTDFGYIIKNLQPDILLIDDFDRTSLARANQNSLQIFEMFHAEYPNMLVILTANYPQRIEKAMLRTGRIDYVIEFDLPDDNERKAIIEQYVKEGDIADMVIKSSELSHADVVGFAKKINILGLDTAFEIITHLKEYQKKSKDYNFKSYDMYFDPEAK